MQGGDLEAKSPHHAANSQPSEFVEAPAAEGEGAPNWILVRMVAWSCQSRSPMIG